MRATFCLLILACCSAPPDPAPLPPMSCPTCPEPACPELVCPKVECPECPAPPEPVAVDWHCFDLHRPTMPVSGFCYASADACTYVRKDLIARRVGKPDPCVRQETAFCIEIDDAANMSRGRMCARTPENCERRRTYVIENPVNETEIFGPCQPSRNTERYDMPEKLRSQSTP